jgi:hypothetical protein
LIGDRAIRRNRSDGDIGVSISTATSFGDKGVQVLFDLRATVRVIDARGDRDVASDGRFRVADRISSDVSFCAGVAV